MYQISAMQRMTDDSADGSDNDEMIIMMMAMVV